MSPSGYAQSPFLGSVAKLRDFRQGNLATLECRHRRNPISQVGYDIGVARFSDHGPSLIRCRAHIPSLLAQSGMNRIYECVP
jgi:hypothetical protein